MEHRWGHRVAVRLDVRLVCRPSAIGAGRLRDVSSSGAFIETDLELPILSQVRIQASDFEVAAHVVRAEPDGIGVEWCALAPWCVSDLQKLAMGPRVGADARGNRGFDYLKEERPCESASSSPTEPKRASTT